jgi:hypothetical protein
MSADSSSHPGDLERARQKKMLMVAIALLIACASALILLPLHRVPFVVRAVAAALDVILAAVLWVFGRQKLSGK